MKKLIERNNYTVNRKNYHSGDIEIISGNIHGFSNWSEFEKNMINKYGSEVKILSENSLKCHIYKFTEN